MHETTARKYVQTGPTKKDPVHDANDPYRTDIRDEPLTEDMNLGDIHRRVERLYALREVVSALADKLDDEGLMATWLEMDQIGHYIDEAISLLVFASSGPSSRFREMGLIIPHALPSRHGFDRISRMASMVVGAKKRTGYYESDEFRRNGGR